MITLILELVQLEGETRNRQQHSRTSGQINIGRYQCWQEDGKLKLYSHQLGKATGMSCAFSHEETRGLLDMLISQSDDKELRQIAR
jgi:hypothetical protein